MPGPSSLPTSVYPIPDPSQKKKDNYILNTIRGLQDMVEGLQEDRDNDINTNNHYGRYDERDHWADLSSRSDRMRIRAHPRWAMTDGPPMMAAQHPANIGQRVDDRLASLGEQATVRERGSGQGDYFPSEFNNDNNQGPGRKQGNQCM